MEHLLISGLLLLFSPASTWYILVFNLASLGNPKFSSFWVFFQSFRSLMVSNVTTTKKRTQLFHLFFFNGVYMKGKRWKTDGLHLKIAYLTLCHPLISVNETGMELWNHNLERTLLTVTFLSHSLGLKSVLLA